MMADSDGDGCGEPCGSGGGSIECSSHRGDQVVA